jgi:hypothetical protein
MTIKEKLIEMLTSQGMFESQATEVFERMKADEANAAMQGRWHDSFEDYPPAMLNIMWVSAKRTALAYIEETCPQAWFKPLFESGAEDKSAAVNG